MTAQSITEWASQVEVPQPIRLGALEKMILAQPLPPREAPAPSLGRRIIEGVKTLITYCIGAVFFFAPMLTAVLRHLEFYVITDPGLTEWLLFGAVVTASMGAAAPVGLLAPWNWVVSRDPTGGHRRARRVIRALAAVQAVMHLGAGYYVFTMPISWAVLIPVIIGVLSSLIIACLLLLKPSWADFSGRDERHRDAPEDHRGTDLSEPESLEERRLLHRNRALRVLNSRQIVDHPTMVRALEMPLGSWHQLDEVL